ncbi:MarR family winged helix-turn-helix transcriptional regulator [Lederbergia panacisoli]|uniref:MarR family winged helix-turn-helix transcriptional regulator n=1 Tax=Lederbergia panacisoli TaxID=1255251 RepID=UPI00214CDE2E|nr:MarR family transcriptional regulator [Lederbergia panacisoli]MCR2822537.1 MarR family transcriptional regulator [Lederbergia panacisoli]
MNKERAQLIFDRYMDIFMHGTKSISTLMSEQLMEELSLEQFSLVRLLYMKGQVRASELAEKQLVHKSAITVRVDKLVKKGLVERQRDEKDRRNVYLGLTKEGTELYKSIESKVNEFVDTIVKKIPETEMESFLNVYVKIADYIENYKGEEE